MIALHHLRQPALAHHSLCLEVFARSVQSSSFFIVVCTWLVEIEIERKNLLVTAHSLGLDNNQGTLVLPVTSPSPCSRVHAFFCCRSLAPAHSCSLFGTAWLSSP